MKPREGVRVEVICNKSEYSTLAQFAREWDETVKKFKKVKWVKKYTPDAKKLEVL